MKNELYYILRNFQEYFYAYTEYAAWTVHNNNEYITKYRNQLEISET